MRMNQNVLQFLIVVGFVVFLGCEDGAHEHDPLMPEHSHPVVDHDHTEIDTKQAEIEKLETFLNYLKSYRNAVDKAERAIAKGEDGNFRIEPFINRTFTLDVKIRDIEEHGKVFHAGVVGARATLRVAYTDTDFELIEDVMEVGKALTLRVRVTDITSERLWGEEEHTYILICTLIL